MSIMKRMTLEKEMKKNPQLKLSDIQSLREWCEKQPHLPKIEDSFLALFLHSNYYQMEPTKNTIENYYTTRTHLPEFFAIGIRSKKRNYDKPSKSHASKLSFGHVARMSPLGWKKMLYYIQNAAPMRLKGIHVINAPSAMELLMNTAKPFMKKEGLSEYIPVDVLPNEMGGKAGSVHELAEIQVKKLEDYREWFLLDEVNRRVNEASRIGKSKSVNDLFGIEGSFKKLDIEINI